MLAEVEDVDGESSVLEETTGAKAMAARYLRRCVGELESEKCNNNNDHSDDDDRPTDNERPRSGFRHGDHVARAVVYYGGGGKLARATPPPSRTTGCSWCTQ